MDKSRIKNELDELVTAELRKGTIIESISVMETLPAIFDAVYIDKQGMKRDVEKSLESKNPFNAFLNLFGIQVIKKSKTIDDLVNNGAGEPAEEDGYTVDVDSARTDRWIAADPKILQERFAAFADAVRNAEQKMVRIAGEQKGRGDKLYDKLDSLEEKYSQLSASSSSRERMIAEQLQYMLASDRDNEQLTELLKCLEIKACWDAESEELTDAAMFSEFKLDAQMMEDPSVDTNLKPCLLKNGEVFIKGVRFVEE